MRSMVVGHRRHGITRRARATPHVPLHPPAGGPPPRAGEDQARSPIINPAVAFALPTTPGIPAPGCVPAPTR
jgi:hypothetical protein